MTIFHDENDSTSGGGSGGRTSWVAWKERGKELFERCDFEGALNAYTQALRPELECPASEQQILWSNIVACRLKIGGSRAQAEAAVQAAKQCVALNNAWAKGHVRLASSYIALGRDHSNDACNALQRALQLDPGNRTARDMLVRELRRDRVDRQDDIATSAAPSAPLEDLDDRNYPSRNRNMEGTPSSSSSSQHHSQAAPSPTPQQRHYPDDDIDHGGPLSWHERLSFSVQRAKQWYFSQNEDVKTVLKVLLGLLLLYVAFGGRFGLEFLSSSSPTGRLSEGGGRQQDVYREFYEERAHRQYNEQRNRNGHQNTRERYDPYEGASRGYDPYHPGRPKNSNSWGGDSSGYGTMLMLAGVAYVAHRNGINPFQALFFANMAVGGRGRRPGGFGGFGRGGGMMGMGGFRHRQFGRPRW